MRWTIRALSALAVLWIAYGAWPYFALYELADAVRARDTAAVARRINFPAVRHSLTEQVVVSYLALTGRDVRLSPISRGLAVSAAASIADPIVARLISADTLLDLLHDGWPTAVLPEKSAVVQGLRSGSLGNFWQVFVQSEQGLRSFAIGIPVQAPPERRFRLQFRLTNWVWKVSGIGLPEELRLRLAQELAKHIDRK